MWIFFLQIIDSCIYIFVPLVNYILRIVSRKWKVWAGVYTLLWLLIYIAKFPPLKKGLIYMHSENAHSHPPTLIVIMLFNHWDLDQKSDFVAFPFFFLLSCVYLFYRIIIFLRLLFKQNVNSLGSKTKFPHS